MNDYRPQAAYPTRVAPELSSVTVTVPAAASATMDTARLIQLLPDMGGEGGERIILERIMAQGCLPTDLIITVDAQDVISLRVPLPPNLLADLHVVGEGGKGVRVTIRNLRQTAIPVTFWYRGRVAGADAGALSAAKVSTLDGATITAPLPDVGARPVPADRNPDVYSVTASVQDTGFHGSTIRGTYTVAAGKKAAVSFVATRVHRMAAAGAGRMRCRALYTEAGGSPVVWLHSEVYVATVGAIDRGQLGGDIHLLTGDKIEIETTNTAADVGDFYGAMHVMEYDR